MENEKREKKEKNFEEMLKEALMDEDEQPYRVPGSWVWVRVNEVIKYTNTGFACAKTNEVSQDDPEAYPHLRPNNIGYGGILNLQKLVFIPRKKVDTDKAFLEKDTILFNNTNSKELVGRSVIIEEDMNYAFSNHITEIRVNNKIILPKWLVYSFNNLWTNGFFLNNSKKWIGQAGINQDMLRYHTWISLPPLSEQKRIVKKLSSMLGKLKQARELIQEARDSFEERRTAILKKAFSGELTKKWREENLDIGYRPEEFNETEAVSYAIPKSWKWRNLGDIGMLKRGKSKHRPRNDKRLFGGKYPFIQTGDIARADDEIVNHRQTLSDFGLKQSMIFPKGTVCITIAANIADTAILTYDCCFPDSVVGFIPDSSKCLSRYINYYMETIKNDLKQYAPAIAQKNINLKTLKNIFIPLQSIEEQKEIVRILDKLLNQENEAKILTDMEEQIEILKKSIFSKAFISELGTNNPDDEPAIELLKRSLNEKLKKDRNEKISKHEKMKKRAEKMNLKDVIQQKFPSGEFTFKMLRERYKTDYETLKQDLFELLDDSLSMRFDKNEETMKFRLIK